VKDPIRSEQGMFELLLWVLGVAAVIVLVVLAIRAVF
jgi:hypothetical protein